MRFKQFKFGDDYIVYDYEINKQVNSFKNPHHVKYLCAKLNDKYAVKEEPQVSDAEALLWITRLIIPMARGEI